MRRALRVGVLGLGVALVVLLAAAVAATARFVVWAPSDDAARADAVVVLAGGAGERLETATRLMDAGVAPVLAVSHGRQPGWLAANRLCDGSVPYDVVCFDPRPDRTQGEARAAARLARAHGWRSVVLVTSRYHVKRATMLLRRCFDGEVVGVGARPPGRGGLPSVRNVFHEWAGYVHAFTLERRC